jgi:hypothetical protein
MQPCFLGVGSCPKFHVLSQLIWAGLHYGGEGLRSVNNAWPRHGYMRQMVDYAGEELKAIK